MSDLFYAGGTPIELLSLVRASDPALIRYVFLVFQDETDSLGPALEDAGATVIRTRRRWPWDLRLIADVVRVVREHQVDVIHTHFARSDIYGTIAGIITRTPVIKGVHGILWNHSRMLQLVDGMLAHYRSNVLCCSLAVLRAYREQTRSRMGEVLYVGVEQVSAPHTRKELRAELGIPEDDFVIAYIGGMIPLRRHEVLVRALCTVADRLDGVTMVFIGDGPLRSDLEALAASLGVAARIRFLGYRARARDLLPACDAYVNPTEIEGFGIAVVEAMQLGVPVLLANAGALPELIVDGESGLLFRPGEAEDLGRKILYLRDAPELREKFGAAGKRRAAFHFSIERYARKMETLYLQYRGMRHMVERPVTVLHLLPDLNGFGGTPHKLYTLVRNSPPDELRHVFYLFNNAQQSIAEDYRGAGAVVLEKNFTNAYLARFLLDILLLIRMHGVDVISTHFARSDFIGLLAGLLSRRPVIRNVHGIHWHPSPVVRFIDSAVSAYRSMTIYNSNASRRAFLALKRDSPSTVVYGGVPDHAEASTDDRRTVIRKQWKIPADAPVLGYVGGLISLRNHALALEAFVRASRALPELRLVFIGDGALRATLERQASAFGVRKHVVFAGHRPNAFLFLCAMDAYVNPTAIEGFGIAVVEAMLAELPVILANAGSLPELVENGRSGILFPPGDAEACARAVVRVLTDRPFAEELGRTARERALARFNESGYARRMMAIYRNVRVRQW